MRISEVGAWPGGTVLDLAIEPASEAKACGSTVLAATFVGIYRSTDGGRRWHLVEADLPDWFVQAAVLAPMEGQTVALAASRLGWLYRSTDGGQHWEAVSGWRDMGVVTRLVASPNFAADGIIFACTEEDGVFKSSDRGRTWRAASFGLLNLSVASLCFSPNFEQDEIVFAGTDGGGLFRSRNAGRAWRESGEGLPNSAVQCLAISPNFVQDGVLFAGTEEQGLYRSVDGGRTWDSVVQSSMDSAGDLSAEACINSLCLATDWATGGLIITATDEGILVSTDAGSTWQAARGGPDYPYVVIGSGSELLAGAYDEGVYRSADGTTWQVCNEHLVAHLPPMVCFSEAFESDRTLLMASMEGTVVRSEDLGATWKVLPQGQEEGPGDVWGTISLLVSTGEGATMMLLAASETELACSQDGGGTWKMLGSVTEEPITAIAFSQTYAQDKAILAGTAGGQVLISRDGGASWEQRASFDGEVVVALAARAEKLYAVTARQAEGGMWQVTLHRGDPWRDVLSREASQPAAVLNLSAAPSLFCAMEQRVLCVSGDTLVTESELGDAEQISSLAVVSDVVLAGSRVGLYRSNDGARSWEGARSDIPVVALYATSPTRAYAVSMGGQVWEIEAPAASLRVVNGP